MTTSESSVSTAFQFSDYFNAICELINDIKPTELITLHNKLETILNKSPYRNVDLLNNIYANELGYNTPLYIMINHLRKKKHEYIDSQQFNAMWKIIVLLLERGAHPYIAIPLGKKKYIHLTTRNLKAINVSVIIRYVYIALKSHINDNDEQQNECEVYSKLHFFIQYAYINNNKRIKIANYNSNETTLSSNKHDRSIINPNHFFPNLIWCDVSNWKLTNALPINIFRRFHRIKNDNDNDKQRKEDDEKFNEKYIRNKFTYNDNAHIFLKSVGKFCTYTPKFIIFLMRHCYNICNFGHYRYKYDLNNDHQLLIKNENKNITPGQIKQALIRNDHGKIRENVFVQVNNQHLLFILIRELNQLNINEFIQICQALYGFVPDSILNVIASFAYDSCEYCTFYSIEEEMCFLCTALPKIFWLPRQWKQWFFDNYIVPKLLRNANCMKILQMIFTSHVGEYYYNYALQFLYVLGDLHGQHFGISDHEFKDEINMKIFLFLIRCKAFTKVFRLEQGRLGNVRFQKKIKSDLKTIEQFLKHNPSSIELLRSVIQHLDQKRMVLNIFGLQLRSFIYTGDKKSSLMSRHMELQYGLVTPDKQLLLDIFQFCNDEYANILIDYIVSFRQSLIQTKNVNPEKNELEEFEVNVCRTMLCGFGELSYMDMYPEYKKRKHNLFQNVVKFFAKLYEICSDETMKVLENAIEMFLRLKNVELFDCLKSLMDAKYVVNKGLIEFLWYNAFGGHTSLATGAGCNFINLDPVWNFLKSDKESRTMSCYLYNIRDEHYVMLNAIGIWLKENGYGSHMCKWAKLHLQQFSQRKWKPTGFEKHSQTIHSLIDNWKD